MRGALLPLSLLLAACAQAPMPVTPAASDGAVGTGLGTAPLILPPSPAPSPTATPTPAPPPPTPAPAATPTPMALPSTICPAGTALGAACVVPQRIDDQHTSLVVGTNAYGETTVSFDVSGKNLWYDDLYSLRVIPAGESFLIAKVRPQIPGQPWSENYHFYAQRGDYRAKPDGTLYRLPYDPGTTHTVNQGWNGSFSHQGVYAVDWGMPVGTPVRAARGGLVIETRADADSGGSDPSRKDDYPVNDVYIRHDDATVGGYLHLAHDGVLVRPGQHVAPGDVIALSGNTGYTTGPHLHFEVQAPIDGHGLKTFPVLFQARPGSPGEQLLEGQAYTAF